MLRHTYATMLFDAGVDVKSAQRFLGHTGSNSFYLYASYKVQRRTGNTKVGRAHKREEK